MTRACPLLLMFAAVLAGTLLGGPAGAERLALPASSGQALPGLPGPRLAASRLAPPAEACRVAIAAAERAGGIPPQLLAAIARVESGRYDAAANRTAPWPWTINAEGRPGVFETKEQAIGAVRTLMAQGVRSIDVGCLQVNLMHHPQAFASLDQAFDPVANANYAARFLGQLREQAGDWVAATARYHSATPEFGGPYQRKVAAVWPEEQRLASAVQVTGIPAQSGRVVAPELSRAGMPVGGFVPPTRTGLGRIIPLALGDGQGGAPGRPLAAYRANPIAVAGRPPG